MLGQILSSIANPSTDNSLISNLLKQNMQIDSELQMIEQSLNQLPFEQIINFLQNYSGFNSSLLSKGERIDQILSIVESFHQANRKSEKQNRRLKNLLEEIQIIIKETESLQILTFIQEPISLPSSPYLSQIKQALSHIGDQLVQYQNFQNAADFHSQEQGEAQRVEYVIKFYLYLREIYQEMLEKSIKRSYSSIDQEFTIELKYIMAVWEEKSEYYTEFLTKLRNFLQRFIRYNINDRQYILKNYTLINRPNSISLFSKTQIIFDSNETSLHFKTIKNSLQILKQSIQRIQQTVPEHLQASILSLKKSILQTIKSHVEYLLPFLKMEQRRELLEELTISHSSFTVDIYELLVSLRMCGKDADMLVRTIKQLVAKVHEDPSSLLVVLKYMELAKENKNNLQLNFFVCDQLIQQFEEGEVSEPIKNAIKILLLTREEQRMKIHSADN